MRPNSRPRPSPDPHANSAASLPKSRAELATGETVELAKPLRRLAARMVDSVILGVLCWGAWSSLPFVLAVFIPPSPTAPIGLVILVFLAVLLVATVLSIGYETAATAWRGQTVGKRMLRIKVISVPQGSVPRLTKSLLRAALTSPLLPIPLFVASFLTPFAVSLTYLPLVTVLIYLSVAWDREYRGWHDQAAGTLVVNKQ
ncbi:RDD family protein [Candidatus Poriferisodalis sp.]|uniref:RDD family protein n=1 Tax=Candidatus Poriferisodalis sp. TaxID=3101277 RepID=UPI003B029B27